MPERTITVVLPVDAETAPALRLAARPATLVGRRIGVVDNGLWRSMELIAAELAPVAVFRFDHTSVDFPKQQAALAEFATDVDLVVSGLGN
jgi:hypothetical protein